MQKNKAKADVQKVEAVQGDLNEVKGSLEQQFTQVSRMQTNIEFRIKENTVKIVKSRLNNSIYRNNSFSIRTIGKKPSSECRKIWML